jgi:hypothetical protein
MARSKAVTKTRIKRVVRTLLKNLKYYTAGLCERDCKCRDCRAKKAAKQLLEDWK